MKLSTFTYSDTNGATVPIPLLKSPDQALIIMFGPSRLLDTPAPVQSILATYPGAATIGCSSSGEILGTHIQDDTLVVALLQFDHTTVRTAAAPVTDPGKSFEAAQSVACQLMDPGLRGILERFWFMSLHSLRTRSSACIRRV